MFPRPNAPPNPPGRQPQRGNRLYTRFFFARGTEVLTMGPVAGGRGVRVGFRPDRRPALMPEGEAGRPVPSRVSCPRSSAVVIHPRVRACPAAAPPPPPRPVSRTTVRGRSRPGRPGGRGGGDVKFQPSKHTLAFPGDYGEDRGGRGVK